MNGVFTPSDIPVGYPIMAFFMPGDILYCCDGSSIDVNAGGWWLFVDATTQFTTGAAFSSTGVVSSGSRSLGQIGAVSGQLHA